MIPKKIIYKGENYYLQTTGRYYQSGNKNKKDRLLHRIIWIEHNGPIPKGMHIHHINGDWQDNRIENLELVWPKEHMREHMNDRMKDPEYRQMSLSALVIAQEAAKKWHASPEGHAWHKKNAQSLWKNKKLETVQCVVCSSNFETYFKSRAGTRFCSEACRQKESYQKHKTAQGKCAYCGKEFFYNKYRKQENCSRVCAIRLRNKI